MPKLVLFLFASVVLFGCSGGTGQFVGNEDGIDASASEIEKTDQEPIATSLQESSMSSEVPISDQAEDSLPGSELFGFRTGEPGWFVVNDSVMGGVSQSQVEVLSGETLYFTGQMSLDNNGGFASVRSDWQPIDLNGNDGVVIRVKGDGNFYRLRIRTTETGRDVSYNAFFPTEKDKWKMLYIPYSVMVPSVRGFLVDAGALDPSTIASFGFMLSDKQEGDFALEVDWIRSVSDSDLADWQGDEKIYRVE